ncbi:MAG: transposase [candidate division WOR-3 bacterium]
MAWHPRLCGENLHHHIYAWGNDHHPIFKFEYHYQRYLEFLKQFSKKFNIDVIAYALMEWHIHLFIFDRLNKISAFMENLHGEYAKYFNADTGRVGHVFGERFNNKIVQPNNYGLWLSRYIHRQPVEAGIVSNPAYYPWTSYRQYIGLEPIDFIKPRTILAQFANKANDEKETAKNYEEFVIGEQECPVDFDASKSQIIGDLNWEYEQVKKYKLKLASFANKEELLKKLSDELNTTAECLLNPKGKKERGLRHKAIEILLKKYKFKVSQIARLLKISRMAVFKVLR